LNDSFNILTATQNITGQFASVSLPPLPWNLAWHLNYLSNAATLSVFVSGDFNKDGLVDAADYVVWRKNNGTQAEFNAWRAHFGQSFATGAGASLVSLSSSNVPEPANVLLLMLGTCAFLVGQRRR
jgi:hypothetical protein